MPDLSNITINGMPLEKMIDESIREEIRSNHQQEVVSISFVVSKSRSNSTSSFRNHSGAKSGRGRVIMANGVLQC